jgi:hypothetical protein
MLTCRRLAIILLGFVVRNTFAAEHSNVILIMADDLSIRDTTPYGSAFFETPNIQRLADRGMVFDNAYAAKWTKARKDGPFYRPSPHPDIDAGGAKG